MPLGARNRKKRTGGSSRDSCSLGMTSVRIATVQTCPTQLPCPAGKSSLLRIQQRRRPSATGTCAVSPVTRVRSPLSPRSPFPQLLCSPRYKVCSRQRRHSLCAMKTEGQMFCHLSLTRNLSARLLNPSTKSSLTLSHREPVSINVVLLSPASA